MPRKPSVVVDRRPGGADRKPGRILTSVPRSPLPGLAPAKDPLDESKYPGTIDGDAKVELQQLNTGFVDRMKAEQKRFKDAVATGYYFVAVFETESQCDKFLTESGLARTRSDLFVDGRILADILGIALPKSDMRYNISEKKSSLGEFVRKPSRR